MACMYVQVACVSDYVVVSHKCLVVTLRMFFADEIECRGLWQVSLLLNHDRCNNEAVCLKP